MPWASTGWEYYESDRRWHFLLKYIQPQDITHLPAWIAIHTNELISRGRLLLPKWVGEETTLLLQPEGTGFFLQVFAAFSPFSSSTTSHSYDTQHCHKWQGMGSWGTFPTRHPCRHCRANRKESCPCQVRCEWPCLYTAPPQSYGREYVFPEFTQRGMALARYCWTLWAAMRRVAFYHTQQWYLQIISHCLYPLSAAACSLTHASITGKHKTWQAVQTSRSCSKGRRTNP